MEGVFYSCIHDLSGAIKSAESYKLYGKPLRSSTYYVDLLPLTKDESHIGFQPYPLLIRQIVGQPY